MDSSRPEYPAAMATLQPDQAIDVFNDRVSTINKINSEIADWIQERRQIEEQYVAGLRKLTRRQAQSAEYGILQVPWDRIVSGAENLASAHEWLSQRIKEDVENPLRSFSENSSEMTIVTSGRTDLTELGKDFDSAQKKADKAEHGSGRKAEDASSRMKDAQRQWETSSPQIFSQLQALDEARINNLRAVLTQLQTHEADVVERNRASAESCLNALLSIEAGDEIKTFAIKISSAPPPPSRGDSIARPSSQGPPAPPPPRLSEGRAGLRAETGSNADREGSHTDEKAHKGKLSGLKRIGTVMRGRKNVAPPPTPAEKKKEKKFSSFRRGDSQNDIYSERGNNLTPIASRDSRLSRSDMTPTAFEGTRQTPTVNGTTDTQTATTPSGTISAQGNQLDALGQVSNQAPAFPQTTTSSQPPNIPYAGAIQPTPAQPVQSVQPTQPVQPIQPTTPSIDTDDTTRNLKILDSPIQEDEAEAQRAMTSMADQLRMQAPASGGNRAQGSVRGRRDVRNTMYVPSTPDATSSGAAVAGGAMLGAAAGAGTVAAVDSVSPLKKSTTSGLAADDTTTASDAGSIHSSHSLAGLAHHPDMHEPGLNVSVVETISAWFNESGIFKSSVVGEVALAYIASGSTASESDTIRLQNFQILEKVAANPTFVSPLKSAGYQESDENAGSYTVSLSSIKRPSPTVGLKYQLHVDDSNMAQFSPLMLNPAWQIVEGQASIIVVYSLNPAFASASFFSALSPLTLKNVVITVSLDLSGEGSGKATSAMMMPTQGASFRRKAGSVVWRFNELTLNPGDQAEKLLVRFMIQGGPVQRGTVEAKFELPGRMASTLGVERSVSSEGGLGRDEDPFADANTADRPSGEAVRWENMDVRKMLVSGRYSAT